ncbi:MAG: ATP-binding protein [Geminicoccaceae bacterium]|nr:ATP-binding protein [Geminicoccaceae bacterium]
MADQDRFAVLERIAAALERLAPPPAAPPSLEGADAFVYEAASGRLRPVARVAGVDLDLLCGIDHVAAILLGNTERFAAGLPANNALLWGARGMGKSSLVKAVHAEINAAKAGALTLIEIHREDIEALPRLLGAIAMSGRRCLLFCDDLSFDAGETSYKSLKAVLEGGLEGRPDNVLFYATSNRRHLMPRQAIENERRDNLHPGEAVEEKVSLSDRFGLWLGFHACDQATYLTMVERYAARFGLGGDPADLRREALEWATTRGHRSGRVAYQFIQDLAGRSGGATA